MHSGSEADSTRSFTCRVDDSVVDLLDVLEELRLGCTRVTKKEHVDITTDPVLIVDILGLATEHGENETLFDELMTVD